jgi:hypothetical protein
LPRIGTLGSTTGSGGSGVVIVKYAYP